MSREGSPSLTPMGPASHPGKPGPTHLHLWWLDLAVADDRLAACAALLTRLERDRADRFRFARDRRRFIVRRAGLRQVLAAYAGVSATDLHFETGPAGKPALAGGASSAAAFNLSDSGDRAVIAVTAGTPVGVDIEQTRAIDDAADLAARFFALGEVRGLAALPEADRPAGFYRCWTRKEAVLKARGVGLSASLGTFEVGLDPRRAGTVTWDGQTWRLTDLGSDGWAGCAATAFEPTRIERVRFAPGGPLARPA